MKSAIAPSFALQVRRPAGCGTCHVAIPRGSPRASHSTAPAPRAMRVGDERAAVGLRARDTRRTRRPARTCRLSAVMRARHDAPSRASSAGTSSSGREQRRHHVSSSDRRCLGGGRITLSTRRVGRHAEHAQRRARHRREHRRGDVAAVVLRRPTGSSIITATTRRGADAGAKPTNDDTYLLRVAAAFELVRGAGLAGDAIARHLRLRRRAAGLHRQLEHVPHRERGLRLAAPAGPRPGRRVLSSVAGFSSPSVANTV